MRRHIYCLMFLFILVAVSTSSSITRARASVFQQDAPSDNVPLPGSCGGVLPPNGQKVCCVSGYVYVDGHPVTGAKVTISTAKSSVQVWTDTFNDGTDQPYYHTDLHDSPLNVQPNEIITMTAEYSSHSRTISHTVLEGGQRVDLVLPRNGSEDYVATGTIEQQGETQHFAFPTGIAVDNQGNVYVADWGNHRIQVYNRRGDWLRAFGVHGNEPGKLAGPIGIAVDSQGNIYIADSFNSRVQKLSSTGSVLAVWGQRGSADGEFILLSGIAIDQSGNVYISDTFNNRIQKFTSDGVHLNTWGSAGNAPGQFRSPVGIAVDGTGLIYIADRDNNRIQRLNPDGTPKDVWDNLGLSYPEGLTLDRNGNIYIADWDNNRIQKLTNNGTYSTQWGTLGVNNGEFHGPRGIAVDNSSDGSNVSIYVTDNENHRVQKFNVQGRWQATFGGRSTEGGQLSTPVGITVDQAGLIYVTEWDEPRLLILNHQGKALTTIGTPGSGPGQFLQPTGVAIDDTGNIYVADIETQSIQMFNSEHNLCTRWNLAQEDPSNQPFFTPTGIAVHGNFLYVADYLGNSIHQLNITRTQDCANVTIKQQATWQGADGVFKHPFGIAADQSGNVYVADSGNDRIQKFSGDGQVLSWVPHGTGFKAFNGPSGIAVDKHDDVYVTEAGPLFVTAVVDTHRVQKFHSDGSFVTTWGSAGGSPGEFVNPLGIVVDNSDTVYVADTRNNRVQTFRPMSFLLPIATINAITPYNAQPGQPIDLYGMADDSDDLHPVARYDWHLTSPDASSQLIGTDAHVTLNTNNLATGIYTVTLRAFDSEDQSTAPQQSHIVIATSPQTADSWTMLLYLDGDTSPDGSDGGSLGPYLGDEPPEGALARLRQASIPANVSIIALYDGPGENNTRLYTRIAGGTLESTAWPEANMGDPRTLADFVAKGKQLAPADHYYLAIADHANPLDGIAWDYFGTPQGGDRLTNQELLEALLLITDGDQHPIDVLHLDGCLMSQIEIAYQFKNKARYIVASENLAWSFFGYDQYSAAIGSQTDPKTFAQRIVTLYSNTFDDKHLPYTIAALDIHNVNSAANAISTFAQALSTFARTSEENRKLLLNLRAQAGTLDSNGDGHIDVKDDFIDLHSWAEQIVAKVSDSAVQQASIDLISVLDQLVYASHEGSGNYQGTETNLTYAHGLGIYYPQQFSARTNVSYLNGSLLFPEDTKWDEFLVAALGPESTDKTTTVTPIPIKPLTAASASLQRVYLPFIQH